MILRRQILSTVVAAVFWLLPLNRASGAAADAGVIAATGDHYPIIMFDVTPSDANFQRVRKIGANIIACAGMAYETTPQGWREMDHYMDLAQKYGLKVMFDLDGGRRIPRKTGMEEMKELVDHFKDNPALAFWYLCDEPDDHDPVITPQMTEKYYHLIKKEAPNIPVCLLTTTGPLWKDYQGSYDIYSFDTYPIADQPFPTANLENVTDFNHWAVQLGKPVMPCLQAFNWVFIRTDREIAKGTYKGRSSDPRLPGMRYPTLEEMRYWNFATLAQGAQGVMYWSFLRGIQSQLREPYRTKAGKDWSEGLQIHPQWMDTTLKQAIDELREFTDLVKPAWKHQIIPSGWNLDLLEAVWDRGGARYVVMVNAFPLTRSIYLTDAMKAPFADATVTPWGFSRKINPYVNSIHRTMIEEMYPWEVLVWKVEPGKHGG